MNQFEMESKLAAPDYLAYHDKDTEESEFFDLDDFQVFPDQCNNFYFWHNQLHKVKHCNKHGGLKGLVCRAVNRLFNYGEKEVVNNVSVRLRLNVSDFLLNSPKAVEERFFCNNGQFD